MYQRLVLFVLITALAGVLVYAQTGKKTVWQGAYTAEQATEGQAQFVQNCSGCHGDQADYRQVGPGFRGNGFMERWREYNANSIFSLIRDTMPRDRPGALTDEQYIDIVARFFQVNGFPPGMEPMTVENMKNIQIEGKDGPKPVPNGSIIQTVACLTQDASNAWVLTKGAEPARTDRVRGSSDDELAQAKTKALGDHTFALLGADSVSGFTVADHKGAKVQVKGYIARPDGKERIDITSMEMLSEMCAAE